MRVLISCLILALSFGCKAGKKGALGGLNDDQFKEFDAIRGNWADAHSAFKSAIGFVDSSGVGRSGDMAKMLMDPRCNPTRKGSYDVPLDVYSPYERSLQGSGCAITAIETKDVKVTKPLGVYSVGVLYRIEKNDFGTLFQREDPIRLLNISGQFTVSKYTGSTASTSGGFDITIANASDINDRAYTGRVDVFDGVMRIGINFSNWQLNATATWDPSSLGTEIKYTIQGEPVTASQFEAAFTDFHIPDMIKYAQNIPQKL